MEDSGSQCRTNMSEISHLGEKDLGSFFTYSCQVLVKAERRKGVGSINSLWSAMVTGKVRSGHQRKLSGKELQFLLVGAERSLCRNANPTGMWAGNHSAARGTSFSL